MSSKEILNQARYDDVVFKLKSKNIKLTDIRTKVIKLIVNNQHLNMQQIIEILQNQDAKGVNVMSVYNTIDLLLKEHIIFSNTFDDKNIWFELYSDDILHIKCDKCGEVQHISKEGKQEVKTSEIRSLLEKRIKNVKHIQIEVHIVCENCTK